MFRIMTETHWKYNVIYVTLYKARIMNDRLCDQTSISKLYKMRLMCLTESVEACKQ